MSILDFVLLLFSQEIISGIITGVIVGLIVWAFQLRREKNEMKHRYDREISILRERLHFVNYKGKAIGLSSVLQAQPVYIEEILAVLKNHPLDLIMKYAHHHKQLAAKLQQFKIKYFEVRKDAEQLDLLANNFIRRQNAENRINVTEDIRYKAYFVGRFHGLTDREILPFLDIEQLEDNMASEYANFKDSFASVIEEYLTARQELLDIVNEVEELVFEQKKD